MQRHMKALLAGVMIIIGFAACGSSGDNSEVTTGRPCADVQRELDAAKAEQTEQAGTPDEQDAADTVSRLEDELESCDDGSNENTTTTEAEEESTTTTTEAEECPDGHVVQLNGNELNRVLRDGITSPDTEEMRAQVEELVGSDPNALFLYYNASPLGRTNPFGDVAGLVEGRQVEDGRCFSDRAIEGYERWLTLWEVAEITPVDSMPEGWSNTGVTEAGPTVGASPSGDTSGWRVTYVDANGQPVAEHGVMKRCANPVVPSAPPGVPEGPTDQAPPATPVPGNPGNPGCPPDKPYGEWPVCKDSPTRDPSPGGGGPEEGPSYEGPTDTPAGQPPPVYVPPTPPTAPPTTQPGPPVTAPPTTSPPATTPPTTSPPTTEIPAPR